MPIEENKVNVGVANEDETNVIRGRPVYCESCKGSCHACGRFVSMTRKQSPNKALASFRRKVEDAILGNYLLWKPSMSPSSDDTKTPTGHHRDTEIALWGVPLSPSKGHPGTDVVLMKFLKARDFRVHEAFDMLRNTLRWRREFKTDSILDEHLHISEFRHLVYMDSTDTDRDGHPLCFHVYEALNCKETYNKIFGSPEACERFLRWRVQLLEKSVQELNLGVPGAPDSIVQITDLTHSPGPVKEFRSLCKEALMLAQEHYPELIHREIIIDAPLWYHLSHILSMKLMNHRTKREFVFTRSPNATKILLRHIAPQNLPASYGGLKRHNDGEFFAEDTIHEMKLRKNSTGHLQIPGNEVGKTMIWDLTTVGWNVSYKEEFIPDDEGSYRVLLQELKEKKGMQGIRNSHYISEPGKILITIDNKAFKKKHVLYRYKAKPTIPVYRLINH